MRKRLSLFITCLFLSAGMAMAQTKITGSVVDDKGEPIIGASITVDGGGKVGTVTDVDGNFSISVPAGKKIIVSYLGMQQQTLSPKSKMQITLHADNQI